MNNVVPVKIQIIAIVISLGFLAYIGRLIVKGKLREEYSFIWVFGALILILFSFWREGLAVIAKLLGVYAAPNLVFMVAIFGIFIYLLHISVVVSQLHEKNKKLSQEIALLKNKIEKIISDKTEK
ncbi:MAG: DUF2304 domain-containing protein [Bacteroidetes bacterium CG02_land_8_20_14_3_00_31_25]|nr:MAG: hypothetical protein COX07_01975 [Bacteroidetes bacterium CG23_combo_of_CG06-09_8_20_14_all_32_9]PIV57916.1 MAG: DUF2304 domain-containing protein [Bacteroidetes bacterium CG02_land_8_20_14_3_00_31_25]PIY02327.1 MAG: DUF2304 domain-containing protein [Bacteroidetes bacterium CG_4_10_14_3_um_filter_31_20]